MTAKRLGANYHKLFISTVVSNVGDGISLIAYPWLASALTRNPLLIAAVALVQRLPWLVFTLPAGVITDRVDRKKAMVTADLVRFGLTLVVAFAVLSRQSSLPGIDELASVRGAAALVAAIPGSFRAERPDDHVQAPWRSELAEGFRWLWANDLLRSQRSAATSRHGCRSAWAAARAWR